MKILFVASTPSHILNFHLPYLRMFKELGWEVHVLSNDATAKIPFADKILSQPFTKSLLSIKNFLAIIDIYQILKQEQYNKISTNTTLAGLVTRAACLFIGNHPRIYHICHGYLFNRKFSIKKYIYLIPEKIVAHVTDVLMVMNYEDEAIARQYHLYYNKLVFINGMGVDPKRFLSVATNEKICIRNKFGIPADQFLYVYAAEFSKRKNHQMLIRAFAKSKLTNSALVCAGTGALLEKCNILVQRLHIENNVFFLGYVTDMPSLYASCDASVSTSKIEGLPFNVIEALGCGIPVVASDIKGHRELIKNGITGFIFQNEIDLIDSLWKVQNLSCKKICQKSAAEYSLKTVFTHTSQVYFC